MSVQDAVNAIIRPFRAKYDIDKLPLTLETDDEEDGGGIFIRQPLEIETPRRIKIRGSMYFSGTMKMSEPGPCVVYLHGNSSNQLEGQFLVPNFTPQRVFVFCFDFAGCGCSEGDYVSLGYFEQKDLDYIIDFLHSNHGFGPFVLWGRSMGAATALLLNNNHVKGIISDSAFSSIRNMVKAIARQKGVGRVFMKPALWLIRKKIKEQAGFDINEVKPVEVCKVKTVPVRFAHSTDDQLIPFEQCKELYESYKGGNKGSIIEFTGGHNGRRTTKFFRQGVVFALTSFGLPVKGVIISPCRKLLASDFHFDNFDRLINTTKQSFNNGEYREAIKQAEQEESTSSFKITDGDDEPNNNKK